MQPTRRRYLAIAGTGIGVGVAGCLSSGSNITYPEPEPDEPADGSENESADDEDEDDEPEEPSVDPINSRLAEATDDIYEELRWFETEYDGTIREHQDRVREVVDALDSLLETLDEQGRIEADQLEDVESFAEEVAQDVNDIVEPHFTDHYNYRGVNREGFPEVDRFRQRSDWDRVESELQELRSIYRGASTSRALSSRYPGGPIDNRLYDERFGGDGGGTMFEVRYISDERNHHPNESDDDLPGYGAYVLNDASRDIQYDPIGNSPLRVRSTMDDDYTPFEESTDRTYRFYVRIHSIGGGGEIDPGQTDSFAVYGQKYEGLEAADAAFESVMEDKEIEDEEDWGDETWNQVIYTRDGDREYAYFLRADDYLFAVGPSRTAWEERDDDWNALLDGTWMNP